MNKNTVSKIYPQNYPQCGKGYKQAVENFSQNK